MIDVIIPAYNAHKTIHQTLYSISIQTIADKLNVYIVNDAGEDYKEYIDFFSNFIKIKEITLKKNGGPGVAREEGLKHSHAKYVTFIDSDDVFADPISLECLYDAIKTNRSDLAIGNFNEQSYKGEYLTHKEDKTWMHGKMYRRNFIEKNNIHFNNSRANEDNAFNRSLLLRDPKVTYVDKKVYIWLYNENSITRRNNQEYSYEGLFGYVENMVWVLEDAIKNKIAYNKIAALALSVFYAMYYYYLNFEKKELATACKRLLEIVEEYPVKNEAQRLQLITDQLDLSKEQLDSSKLLNPKISDVEFKAMVKES